MKISPSFHSLILLFCEHRTYLGINYFLDSGKQKLIELRKFWVIVLTQLNPMTISNRGY